MKHIFWGTLTLLSAFLVQLASATPYEFTDRDYIEYGIYFSPRGSETPKRPKLLTIRYGDLETWYKKLFPHVRTIPTVKQQLNIATPKGSISLNRNDNVGLRVARETFKPNGHGGTKRLEVSFQNATCSQPGTGRVPCSVELLLTSDYQDKGVVRSPRTLEITTSSGLSFRYRSIRRDGFQRYTRELRRLINRSPVINNFAWEGRYEESAD